MLFREFTQGIARLFQGLAKKRGKDPWSEIAVELRAHLIAMDTVPEVAEALARRVVEEWKEQHALSSVAPSQLLLSLLAREIREILGDPVPLQRFPRPAFFTLVGLQGTGKTTTAQKLGVHLRALGEQVLLVPLDLRRPAAVEQLKLLGEKAGLPVFTPEGSDPLKVARAALKEVEKEGYSAVIYDTAGRHTLEEELLKELLELKKLLNRGEVLYVLDATQGQSAYPVLEGFRRAVALTGIVISKVDLDPKGGGLLSIRYYTRIPLKGMGIGEHPEDFRPFDPQWLTRQLLDLGDLEGLLGEFNRHMEEYELAQMGERLLSGKFHLQDLLRQMELLEKMGPFEKLLGFLPGGKTFAQALPGGEKTQGEMRRMMAIIRSMTPEERHKPQIIQGRRLLRIARGSGTDPQEVRRLLKQYEQMKKLSRKLRHLPPSLLQGGSPLSFLSRGWEPGGEG